MEVHIQENSVDGCNSNDEDSSDGEQLKNDEDQSSPKSSTSKSPTSSKHSDKNTGPAREVLSTLEKYKRRAEARTVQSILNDEDAIKFGYSDSDSVGGESDIWTEYGQEVCEETGNKDVYTKWKPPKNKLTQEIRRRKSIRQKGMQAAELERRESRLDTALTSVTAGQGKTSSQIFFYDWSENYRKVLKEMKSDAKNIKAGSQNEDSADHQSESETSQRSSSNSESQKAVCQPNINPFSKPSHPLSSSPSRNTSPTASRRQSTFMQNSSLGLMGNRRMSKKFVKELFDVKCWVPS
ncbi:uncharacterized protein LOC111716201 [Eurytemora carolleeae]|uniref:uncharacterized protein LOC111716201 n=1 Tax=Eurytemora carolleeae TaxID=1294199 RepID=UPI000C7881A4|nr:uncharacterized protein LOC111716201 [Eurytemora carolleeae]|eukprot:XP_023347413.1 uncharacterized protein LOC111716201 [Eurytemora affinis]